MTDKQEFERIFRQYYGGMFRLTRKMLGDDQESKDVVSDVFAQLLNRHQPPRRHLNGFQGYTKDTILSINTECFTKDRHLADELYSLFQLS